MFEQGSEFPYQLSIRVKELRAEGDLTDLQSDSLKKDVGAVIEPLPDPQAIAVSKFIVQIMALEREREQIAADTFWIDALWRLGVKPEVIVQALDKIDETRRTIKEQNQ